MALYSIYRPCFVHYCYHVWWCTILFCFYCIVLCPCMAINVSVQHNGGLLPDVIVLLTEGYFHRGTRKYAMKRLNFCSLCFHLNVLTFPPPPLTGGCSEGSGAFWFYFKYHIMALYSIYRPCFVHYCYHVWWCTILFCSYCIFLCACIAINVSVQYNGGLLPDIIILVTQGYFHRGTR